MVTKRPNYNQFGVQCDHLLARLCWAEELIWQAKKKGFFDLLFDYSPSTKNILLNRNRNDLGSRNSPPLSDRATMRSGLIEHYNNIIMLKNDDDHGGEPIVMSNKKLYRSRKTRPYKWLLQRWFYPLFSSSVATGHKYRLNNGSINGKSMILITHKLLIGFIGNEIHSSAIHTLNASLRGRVVKCWFVVQIKNPEREEGAKRMNS